MSSTPCKLTESNEKEGIYYVLKFPNAWRIYAFPVFEFGDLWHAHAWKKYAINDLAAAWAPKLNLPEPVLKSMLAPLHKGFPRGRVERTSPMEITILHGNDLAETGISSFRVLRAFELDGCCVTWSFDPHECCDPEQKSTLANLFS